MCTLGYSYQVRQDEAAETQPVINAIPRTTHQGNPLVLYAGQAEHNVTLFITNEKGRHRGETYFDFN